MINNLTSAANQTIDDPIKTSREALDKLELLLLHLNSISSLMYVSNCAGFDVLDEKSYGGFLLAMSSTNDIAISLSQEIEVFIKNIN